MLGSDSFYNASSKNKNHAALLIAYKVTLCIDTLQNTHFLSMHLLIDSKTPARVRATIGIL